MARLWSRTPARACDSAGWFLAITFLGVTLSVAAQTEPRNTNVTYVSGTCKTASPSFNMSTFYNQQAMLVTDLTNVDVSGADWDLGKDGAYVGFSLFMCLVPSASYPGYTPPGLTQLIEQKGFQVTQSCNMAGLLRYPRYQVFMIVDRTETLVISNADAQAVADFYTSGGGMFVLTDNCPYNKNANLILSKMPPVLSKLQLLFNNNIVPFPLYNGNPVGNNQFGHHPIFTGVPQMSSGHSLTIPYYEGKMGLGVLAPMCTVVIDRVPIACGGESVTPTYLYSHPTVFYADPPVQLVNVSGACNWGRIVFDTAWTRYGVAPMRTGSWRFGANTIVWLLNIEKINERNSTGQGPYSPMNCSATNTSGAIGENQTQVLGCSNGDAVTLKSPTLMCNVGFAGPNAPSCLALVVTETSGTTCVLNTANAQVGTYWIMVDGQNTSLQFTVTASSLVPRGTVVAVTGTCVADSKTSISGCTDGSSVTIDWTLPYPRSLTVGLGSSSSICSSFSVSGTLVNCVFRGLNTMARGKYQTYINGVATGIPINVLTDIAALNKVLCSITRSPSPQDSNARTASSTRSATVDVSASSTWMPSVSPSQRASFTASRSLNDTSSWTVTTPLSGTVTETDVETASSTGVESRTMGLAVTATVPLARSATYLGPATVSVSENATLTISAGAATATNLVTPSRAVTTSTTVAVTRSETWACVDSAALASVLSAVAASLAAVTVDEAAIQNGTVIDVVMPPTRGLESPGLHVPWFLPWNASAYLTAVFVPNQLGFVDRTGYRAGVVLSFPQGLGAPNTSSTTRESTHGLLRIVIPPTPDYKIFVNEAVTLGLALHDATLGRLCPADNNNSSSSTIATLVALSVVVNVDQLLASAQLAMTSIVSVMAAATPFAAPDLQALIMVSMMPCSNSYQKRTFAMFRALSLFTLDDTYEGVLWGNLIANCACIGVHAVVVAVISLAKKKTLAEASVAARFPGLTLQTVWLLTFSSNAFAALQLLSGSGSEEGATPTNRGVGAGVLLVFCIGVPAALAVYVLRYVEAYFSVYEYHKWRRADTALRVRLLSTVLLPVGRWEPEDVRRRLGTTLTLQCRPEFYWMLLPLVSPTLVALFSLVRNQTERVCLWVYLLLAFLHLLLMAVVVLQKPLRTMFEDWLAVGAYAVTVLYLVCTAINLAYPPVGAVRSLLGVVIILQVALLVVRTVYHVAHVFIARRLVGVVPKRVLFEWNFGTALVDESVASVGGRRGVGDEEMTELEKLYASLETEMNADGDDGWHGGGGAGGNKSEERDGGGNGDDDLLSFVPLRDDDDENAVNSAREPRAGPIDADDPYLAFAQGGGAGGGFRLL